MPVKGYEWWCCCQPDLVAEWRLLAGRLPGGVLTDNDFPGRQDPGECEVLAWARSGLMHLSGGEEPGVAPAPVLARTALLTGAIAELARRYGSRLRLDPRMVLASRSRELGLTRHGQVSANGSCRLLSAADGWLAVSLARDADVHSLPAVLGHDRVADPWTELSTHASSRAAADVATAAQLVGIPAAVAGSEPARPITFVRVGEPGPAARLVLDLSAMWAGPLCARILHGAGWRVLKVEHVGRPDGARSGPPRFYAQLHEGIPAIRLDFASESGRSALARLASQAGIVVESSRPRALRRLGLIAEDWLAAAPGRVWISVTGYGRDDPQQRVAFGDDAAVAGGLTCKLADGTPAFCGDAIGDPLTGLHAGLAALAADAAGGGLLADVAMAAVCADLATPATGPSSPHTVSQSPEGWTASHGKRTEVVRRS
jgi:CoA-transferase family III